MKAQQLEGLCTQHSVRHFALKVCGTLRWRQRGGSFYVQSKDSPAFTIHKLELSQSKERQLTITSSALFQERLRSLQLTGQPHFG